MTHQKIYQVDAFTTRPFAGNPAAVCILPTEHEESWMMAVAREMNLSETAFLVRQAEGYRLRWFTPKKEVRLCGHATLASAHVLWESGALAPGEAALFDTLSGRLAARKAADWIEMDFPARQQRPADLPPELHEALGAPQVRYAGLGTENAIWLIELEDEAAVRDLKPDFSALARLPVRSVIVTARASSPGYDIVSRYFAPAVGVNEDPVTGSAHCYLTPYWTEKMGLAGLSAYQASERGGQLRLRLDGERVMICGQAVTVMVGELLR